jgi:hypothetical protein
MIAAWALAILVGARLLLTYSNTAGTPAAPPADWPAQAPVEHAEGHTSLVIFIHPQCQCSRASIGELDRILVSVNDRVQTTVFFYVPANSSGIGARPQSRLLFRSACWDRDSGSAAVRRERRGTFSTIQAPLGFSGGVSLPLAAA